MLPVMAVCLLQYRQIALQRRGKERLEKELLQTVSVPKEALRWAKQGKEIWINDHLFDVKSYSLVNNVYIFKGLYDEDETLVVKALRQQNRQQNDKESRLLGQLFQLLKSVYSSQEDPCVLDERSCRNLFSEKNYPLASLFKLVNTPPPRA
jgi:hypothetical protein